MKQQSGVVTVRRAMVLAGFALCAALAGCGGSSPLLEGIDPVTATDGGDAVRPDAVQPDAPLPDVTGRYSGMADVTSTPVNPPGMPQTSTGALVIAVTLGASPGQLVFTLSPEQAPCVFTATRAGSTASALPGTTCMSTSSGTTATVTIESATAMFSGNTLTFRLLATATVSGTTTPASVRTLLVFSGTRP